MNAPGPLARLGLKLAASASLLVRLPLVSVTGQEPDCWRRILGLGLRTEGAKFGLSAFGLDLFSDLGDRAGPRQVQAAPEAHFAERLASFLDTEPDAHWCLRHLPHHVERASQPMIRAARHS